MTELASTLNIDPSIWKCSICGAKHSIEEWDKSTLRRCNNRKARRDYKSLGILSCRLQGSKRIYLCPSCDEVVQGYNVKQEL